VITYKEENTVEVSNILSLIVPVMYKDVHIKAVLVNLISAF
jgi:hypothetical protein